MNESDLFKEKKLKEMIGSEEKQRVCILVSGMGARHSRTAVLEYGISMV